MISAKNLHYRHLVLVVDDQEINRDVLGAILEDDYDLIYASDGQEALSLIDEYHDKLSIILLDLMMPVMNGFEVLAQLGNSETLRKIPVIVLTAEKNAELQALKAGAVDFITKPFDMHEIILARVKRIIDLSEGQQLIHNAEKDPISGLYSQNFFKEYCERIFINHTMMRMDAIVLNVEHFHSINNLKGRIFGDKVLAKIGDIISTFLGSVNGIASRYEADIFYIYCEHQEDYEGLLEHFQSDIDKSFTNVSIILRMGVKPWREKLEPVVMFDRARSACNMVRGNYMTHLMIFDDGMLQKERYNQRLLNDLRAALDEHQFIVFYQPKYNIQYDPPMLSSAEALIRWKHPELGMISPGDFIPLFESHGLIHYIDEYVWNEAARQITAWREKLGFTLPMSVNLSRTDIFDPELEKKLLDIIDGNGLTPDNLKLEVTESAYTDNANQLIAVIDKLRTDGFQIEMDDFGSGYSSLNMLSTLPIDVLKIDMKFIRNIHQGSKEFRLVELILDIARYLNVPVVAEGVETEEQCDMLRNSGCDLVQGYFFSRPLPPQDFEGLIHKEMEQGR
jgi:EAL domain-containing protein (putative c-di-GMP-specific phosphodiesterase class I)/FixJ family two-component response regulator